MNIDVVIPSYRGHHLLLHCLPHILACSGLGNVIIVDDGSADDTAQKLKERFPEVKCIERRTNGGFSAAVNDGIRASSSEFLLILNNDVEIPPNLLSSLLPVFDDESIFAVSPRILISTRNNLDEAAKTGFWRHGLFYIDQDHQTSSPRSILYSTGCAALYRRKMLLELGGFDEIYSPFYWEDADLGYRAWKRGWRSVYEPAATIFHHHSASISRMNSGYVNRIKARNSLLFIWRNIEDVSIRRKHRIWLPLVLTRRLAAGEREFFRGWKLAQALRFQAQRFLEEDARHRVLSDRDIFKEVGIQVR